MKISFEEKNNFFNNDYSVMNPEMTQIRDSIWNLSTQSEDDVSSWWCSMAGFKENIFAEWFFLALFVKMKYQTKYFKLLSNMENNIEYVKSSMAFISGWQSATQRGWLKYMKYKTMNAEEDSWAVRFSEVKIRKKIRPQQNHEGVGGVT